MMIIIYSSFGEVSTFDIQENNTIGVNMFVISGLAK